MYHEYFGLKEPAFSIAVNPKYLYMSRQHKEALAHLIYGVQSGGFVMLSGEVGTGKTTIIRCLLDQLPKKTEIAIVLNPMANVHEMLLTVCEELGVKAWEDGEPSIKNLTDYLYTHLLNNHMRGKNTVLLIDEAQMLSAEVLEQIRLLTNLETNSQKLLQIVLVGQPELSALLAQPRLRQLSQRITARFHLEPLSPKETEFYIEHRLAIAGKKHGRKLFPPKIMRRIHQFSGGVPRLINILCERLLIGAYGHNKFEVDDQTFKIACKEVEGNRKIIANVNSNNTQPPIKFIIGASVAVGIAISLILFSFIRSASNDESDTPFEGPIEREVNTRSESELTTPATPINERQNVNQDNKSNTAQEDTRLTQETQTRTVQTPVESQPITQIPVQRLPSSAAERYQVKQESIALDRLFKAHDITTSQESYPCWDTDKHGLSCERSELKTWEDLRNLNRPAVLELITYDKYQAYIAIVGLNDTYAVVINDQGQRVAAPLADLGQQWTGHVFYLWKKPKSFTKPLAYGSTSPVIEWVARQFSLLDRQTIPLAGKNFTVPLRERLKLFQAQYNLESDGIIGTRTIMKLNEALGLAKELEKNPIEIYQGN